MTTPTTNTSSASTGKQEAAKQWIQKRLRKLPSIQPTCDGDGGLRERLTTKRAPSNAVEEVPAVPPIPITFQRLIYTTSIQPPSRPPRPNSGVIRDVNAWLDASVNTPSPPLMGGVSYWKSGAVTNAKHSRGTQHAIPIVREPEPDPPTLHSRQVKSFRRRARKIHVQMPQLVRNTSHRIGIRGRKLARRSNSMPVFAVPYEEAQQAAPPRMMTRTSSCFNPPLRAVTAEQPRHRYESPVSAMVSETESSIERRMHAIFGMSARSVDSTRPSTAAAHLTRENSLGDLSDAPTYFSGPPPPSYRSRPESILSTSSFGCIDGMNPAQRQISQQRAAEQHSVKGKLKRFAQNFTT